MTRMARSALAAFTAAIVLSSCQSAPASDGVGVSRTIGDEPLSDDEVTLHMANPPELPPALDGAVVIASELRTEDRTSRETVQLVDVPSTLTSVDEMLPAGAVLRVPAGQTVEVRQDVDVASLDPDAGETTPGTLRDVRTPCAAPCSVAGPALIAPAGWMEGFAVGDGWLLLVPSPIG